MLASDSTITRDPRPRPKVLSLKINPTAARDPRPRPNVGLKPAQGPASSITSTQNLRPQGSPTNSPVSIQLYPETSSMALPPPSEACGQIVAASPRSAGHNWLTREDLKKMPKISKIKHDAKAAPASASGLLERAPMLSISTPIISTPPQSPFDLRQRHEFSNSEITTRPCTLPSGMQPETSMPMTITRQQLFSPQRSTGQNSGQTTPTTGPFNYSEASPVLSFQTTLPLSPTANFNPPSSILKTPLESTAASLVKGQECHSSIQEPSHVDVPWGRNNGVQSTPNMEVKEIHGPSEKAQNRTSDFRGSSPHRNARNISSQVQRSSLLAQTVTDANGETFTKSFGDPLSPHTIVPKQTRSSEEFNMESYNSCDCRSDGGEECIFCRVLKGAFEFCKRVDHMVK